MSYFHRASYFTSAASLQKCPPEGGLEVAFIGRSNVGKSTALNAITQHKSLARTSKTPGRTQLINYFSLDEKRHLVDLPGYGYAKVPEEIRKRWASTIEDYLFNRQSLKGIVLLIDIRHPLKAIDLDVMMLCPSKLPMHILLTKADKLKTNPAKQALISVNKALSEQSKELSIQLFSATKGNGLDEARQVLSQWLHIDV